MEKARTNLDDDLARYIDENGLCSDRSPATAGGNNLLWTALELMARQANGGIGEVRGAIIQTNLEKKGFLVEPGLYQRKPDGGFGHISHDDLYGLGVISQAVDQSIVVSILTYMEGWHPIPYNYNSANPGKFSFKTWFGRMPHLIAHLNLAYDKEPCLIARAAWQVAQNDALQNIRLGENIEAAIHGYCRAWVASNSKFLDYQSIGAQWIKNLNSKIPGGLGAVLASWGSHWLSHPVSKALRG